MVQTYNGLNLYARLIYKTSMQELCIEFLLIIHEHNAMCRRLVLPH